MQKIATKVFIYASLAFGIFGILLILAGGPDGEETSVLIQRLHQLISVSVFVILPSFALSLAGKYLQTKS